MIYRGTVRNGVVVLPPDVHLADGQSVTVQPVGDASGPVNSDSDWPDGYFEETAGALVGQKLERSPQGDLPKRDDW